MSVIDSSSTPPLPAADVLRSVRSRVTTVAFVSTLLVLAAAAIALLFVIERSLLAEIDTTITNRASDVTDGIVLNDELNNASFPTDGETFIGVLETEVFDDPILWVHNDIDPDPTEFMQILEGRRPFERFGTPTDAAFPSLDVTDGADNMRVVFGAVPTGTEVVVVARSLDSLDRTVNRVRNVALAAVPLLSLGIGFLVWMLVGRALRPVETMRQEVEAIRSTDLRRRVPEEDQPSEIGDLAKTMNSMLARLDTAQQRQQRFAADAAHELRSPLASIIAQLDVDATYPDDADLALTARRVRGEAERLQSLIDDLMTVAHAEGIDVSRFRPVDLDDVIRVAVDAVPPGTVNVNAPPASGFVVRGDRRQLERLVTNLVSNAVRHAHNRVDLVVSGVPGVSVTLWVRDNGAGIADADRERIFERFVRLDDARSRDAGGTGLGLALAREIAEQHGGRLFAEDSVGSGATFTLELPALA